MRIWALGDGVVDLLPFENMKFEACAGGAPVNVAVGAARLGCESGFIGRVGNDPFGHFLHRSLTAFGVNTRQMQFDEKHHTSTVVVSLNDEGERQFDFLVSASADRYLTRDALPDFGADILHFCSLALAAETCRNTLERAIENIRRAGGVVSFDINLREQMWSDAGEMFNTIQAKALEADVLKLSEEEWYWLTGSHDFTTALARLEAYPARLKLVTYGAQGTLVIWQGKAFHFFGFRVESIDTTGAGDAFMAGTLSALSRSGWPETFEGLAALVTQASACGALATTQKGALTAIADRQQLELFLQSSPTLEVESKG
ncbi:TPA: aminoimidazole riboside kinase [Enterobacter cancerogenus]|nr:aminoimidazole riboside kinase [Enterobacter chengduensis]